MSSLICHCRSTEIRTTFRPKSVQIQSQLRESLPDICPFISLYPKIMGQNALAACPMSKLAPIGSHAPVCCVIDDNVDDWSYLMVIACVRDSCW